MAVAAQMGGDPRLRIHARRNARWDRDQMHCLWKAEGGGSMSDETPRERAYHAGFEEFDRTDDLRAAFDAVLTCVAGHSDDPERKGYDAGHERGRMIGREEGWREAMGPDRGDEYVLLRPDGNEERWTNLEAFLRGCIRIATASLAEGQQNAWIIHFPASAARPNGEDVGPFYDQPEANAYADEHRDSEACVTITQLSPPKLGAVSSDEGRAATHSDPKEDAILAAWQATSPALRSTPWLAFRSGVRAVAASPDEGHRDAIVLWTCSRCERVTRWHDGEEPPTCVGLYERDLSEAEHEPTPMLAVPLRAVAASPDALTGCTPCSDCGIDYAALTGAWLVSDECWQRFVGTDPSIVLCPRCFISRVDAVLSDG